MPSGARGRRGSRRRRNKAAAAVAVGFASCALLAVLGTRRSIGDVRRSLLPVESSPPQHQQRQYYQNGAIVEVVDVVASSSSTGRSISKNGEDSNVEPSPLPPQHHRLSDSGGGRSNVIITSEWPKRKIGGGVVGPVLVVNATTTSARDDIRKKRELAFELAERRAVSRASRQHQLWREAMAEEEEYHADAEERRWELLFPHHYYEYNEFRGGDAAAGAASPLLYDDLQQLFGFNFTEYNADANRTVGGFGVDGKVTGYGLDPNLHKHVLNLIRIPKAGSSAMSVTARALAGCRPDGYPCCQFGGRPSCPLNNLYCDAVLGCVGHSPRYPPGVVTVTVLRHPVDRLLSAFFYDPPHRPEPGKNRTWECFANDYVPHDAYRNVLTKMLAGNGEGVPYDPAGYRPNDIHTPLNAKRRLCQLEWFGLAENGAGSALLLYETPPFSHLRPNPVAFGLPPRGGYGRAADRKRKIYGDRDSRYYSASVRTNPDGAYIRFKTATFVENGGRELVERHNADDLEVYDFGVRLFCARVREAGGGGGEWDLLKDAAEAGLPDLYGECPVVGSDRPSLSSKKLCTFEGRSVVPPNKREKGGEN